MTTAELVGLAAPDDPEQVAEEAGLRYVSDQEPGIRRRRRGKGFSYQYDDGSPVKSVQNLERIKALVVPPAWTDVWICRDERGHLQATGRDDRGRKQYRYHDLWRKTRDANKFDRLLEFGTALGPLRSEIEERRGGDLSRENVLATVVHLLDETLVRVGNAEYAQDNETFGLTTLRDDHVDAGKRQVVFRFVGKHGQLHEMSVRDAAVARVVRQCHELGGKDLFTYVDETGERATINSSEVNRFLRELTKSPGISAKDFRTWGATVIATEVLTDLGSASTKRELDHNILIAIDEAADRLHNTRTVCRNCYVHPAVARAYESEQLLDLWKDARSSRWYSRAERATLLALEAEL